jgi:Uma2 family endonuclease
MSVAPMDPPSGGWSAEEYDALPVDGYRRELIDGVLHVSPSPAGRHQVVVGLLMGELFRSAPLEYVVTQGVEIKLAERLRYIPDVLAVTAEAYGVGTRAMYRPHEVALVVEIVSESSRGMDRILKPHHYATAGIPCYWRIEFEPKLAVHTFEIGLNGEYVPTGEHRRMLTVEAPWPISLDLSRIDR